MVRYTGGMPGSERYSVLDPRAFSQESLSREQFELDVLLGLSGTPKTLPSKYFYDEEGSHLFSKIMDAPEYYPTKCEAEILEQRSAEVARLLWRAPFDLIELGAGDGRKTRLLIDALRRAGHDFRYVPVDISESAVAELTESMASWHPDQSCHGLVCDYFDAFRWLARSEPRPKLVLFLGSNIGNFNGPQARVFLRTLWNALSHGDHLLVGFDLKKDIDVMLAAYNDARGVTARFNLHLLERINQELDGHFQLDKFDHFGTYNVFSGAMESYLLSLSDQEVFIGGLNKRFHFSAYEPVHVEYSFKFLPGDIEALGRETGFAEEGRFNDSRGYFTDVMWRVVKTPTH